MAGSQKSIRFAKYWANHQIISKTYIESRKYIEVAKIIIEENRIKIWGIKKNDGFTIEDYWRKKHC